MSKFPKYLTIFFFLCLLSGCDFIYGLLQKEGAEEKQVLGSMAPMEHNLQVKKVQTFLKLYGYSVGNPDGVMGTNTRIALGKFQEDNDLKPSRFVDFETWGRLQFHEEIGLLKDGKLHIPTVQQALKKAGFDPGSLDGASAPQLLDLAQLDITVDLRNVLAGRFKLSDVHLVKPVVHLERTRAGVANWKFAGQSAEGAGASYQTVTQALLARTDHLTVEDGHVTYLDAAHRTDIKMRFATQPTRRSHHNLYLAATHPDVGTGGSQHWLLAYIGNGSAGSTDGVAHGLQQPTLEFQANFLIRWKLDDSYSSLETWNGASWTSASPLFDSGGAVRSESGNTVELSVPLTTLAVTSQLDLAMTLLYEGAGFESTYGASPAGAITEGAFDPSIALYWPFDRASALAPSGYSPAP